MLTDKGELTDSGHTEMATSCTGEQEIPQVLKGQASLSYWELWLPKKALIGNDHIDTVTFC